MGMATEMPAFREPYQPTVSDLYHTLNKIIWNECRKEVERYSLVENVFDVKQERRYGLDFVAYSNQEEDLK